MDFLLSWYNVDLTMVQCEPDHGTMWTIHLDKDKLLSR